MDADLVAARSSGFLVIPALKQRPANRGHMLVVPEAHVVRPTQLDPPQIVALTMFAGRVADAARAAFGASGVMVFHNESVPDQVIEHLHVHVVPRSAGDAFRIPEPASEILGETIRREQALALRKALGGV